LAQKESENRDWTGEGKIPTAFSRRRRIGNRSERVENRNLENEAKQQEEAENRECTNGEEFHFVHDCHHTNRANYHSHQDTQKYLHL